MRLFVIINHLAFYRLYLLAVCFFPLHLFAQHKTDSITQLILKEKNESKKAVLYLERALTYAPKNLSNAYADVERATTYFKSKNDVKHLVDCHLTLADVYFLDGKPNESVKLDSLALSLCNQLDDTKRKARAFGNLGRELYLLRQFQNAELYVQQAISLEESFDPVDYHRLGELYNRMGIIKDKHKNLIQSADYFQKAIDIGIANDDYPLLLRAYTNYANTLNQSSQYKLAIQHHLKAIHLSEKLKDTTAIVRSYNNAAITFRHLKEYDQAIHYYQKCIALAQQANDHYRSLGLAWMNLANTRFIKSEQTEKNLDSLYEKASDAFTKAQDKTGLALNYHNYGNYLVGIGKNQSAKENLLKALELRRAAKVKPYIASSLSVLGKLSIEENKLNEAKHYLDEAEAYFKEDTKNSSILLDIYTYQKRLYEKLNDYKKAFAYQQKEIELRNIRFDESEKVNALKLQTEYELSKKDHILALEKENQQRRQRYFFSIGGFVVLLLFLSVAFLLQRRSQSRKIHKAELVHIRQKHRLDLADSLSKAEQEERKKIAGKLHDETGGILSIAKLNIDQLEKQVFVAGSDAPQKLATTKKLLVQASESIRSISHSLMPVALNQYGLKAGINELVQAINTSGKIKIEEVIEGLDNTKTWNAQLKLVIYRMIQEVFNNIIKHSQATHVLMQIVEFEDSVTIYIEDNGDGMEENPNGDGMGMKMLKQNIEYLNGKVEINGNKNKGTFVLAELPIGNSAQA